MSPIFSRHQSQRLPHIWGMSVSQLLTGQLAGPLPFPQMGQDEGATPLGQTTSICPLPPSTDYERDRMTALLVIVGLG